MLDPVFKSYLSTSLEAGRRLLSDGSPFDGRTMLEERAAAAPAGRPVAHVEDVLIPSPEGAVPARVYSDTETPLGTLVFYHGGGWAIGSVNTYDRLCRELAVLSQQRVVSVDYRRAPDNVYPAAHRDAEAAARWVAETYEGPLGAVGDSAGGNLAAHVVNEDAASGSPRFVLQVLVYPVVDSDLTRPSFSQEFEVLPMLAGADMEWFWDLYVPDRGQRANADVSPLRLASHAGVPPTFFVSAQLDPLRDEGLAYADKLVSDGVDVRIDRFPGLGHGFFGLLGVVPQSAATIGEIARWTVARFTAVTAS